MTIRNVPTTTRESSKKKIILYAFFLLIFVASYSLTPLYTSNQNQYFLHGMARAGLGSLNQDWLATTADPAPAFTFLVEWTFRLLKSNVWFYFYYLAILGVYFYSLLGINANLFKEQSSRRNLLVTACVIIFSNSYLLRYLLMHFVGSNWGFLFDGGVADQKILGTVLQPSIFGVFFITSLLLFLIDKPFPAVFMACLTAVLHPTYLLSAAMLVFGFMIATIYENKNFKKALLLGIAALVFVAPIVLYVFGNFSDLTSPNDAASILVNIRIPHHALIKEWFDFSTIIKIGLILLGIVVVRKQYKISIPLLVVFILSLAMTVLQFFINNDQLALMFPWRVSALLVPVCSTILLGKLGFLIADRVRNIKWKQILRVGVCLALALTTCFGIYRSFALFNEKSHNSETALYTWIKTTSTDNDKFLIPIGLETFRTSTLRPAYVDFFSIPYASQDVVDWYHRVLSANKYYDEGDCAELFNIRHGYKVKYVVVDNAKPATVCTNMRQVYADAYYTVFKYGK